MRAVSAKVVFTSHIDAQAESPILRKRRVGALTNSSIGQLMLSLAACFTTTFVVGPSTRAVAASSSRAAAALMREPGTQVDLESIGWEERTWFKRDPDAPLTEDGACFIVSDEESPDPEKQWFFCSDPSDDENMTCELVPEWMSDARRQG